MDPYLKLRPESLRDGAAASCKCIGEHTAIPKPRAKRGDDGITLCGGAFVQQWMFSGL